MVRASSDGVSEAGVDVHWWDEQSRLLHVAPLSQRVQLWVFWLLSIA
jgi:hypothetical protein